LVFSYNESMKRKWLLLVAFFAVLTLVITFPAVLSLKTKMIGDMGDGYQFIGFQYIAKKLFFSGQFPFGWTNFWRYPYGINFANSYDSSLLIILGLAFYQFTNNPILVYNLSIILFILLGLAISYYSFSIFFNSTLSIAGSVLYGLSFYSIARLGGHINLFLIPSFLLFFVSLYEIYRSQGSSKSIFMLTLSTLLIPFSSLQFPLILIGALPFLLFFVYLFFKKELTDFFKIILKERKKIVLYLSVIFIVFFTFHGQKLIGLFNSETQFPVSEITSTPIVNFFVPNQYLSTISSIFFNNTKSWIEYVVFFGYLEIALFIIALYKAKRTRLFWFMLSVFSVFFIISLGQQDFAKSIWPYQYLFPLFPYRGIIEPGRFTMFSYLAMVVTILLYLKSIKNKKIIILIITLLIFERLPLNFQLSPNLYDKDFITALKNSPSHAVLHLPLYVDWFNGQYYNMYFVYSNKAMVNGYIQWSGNTPNAKKLTQELEEYTCYPNPETAPNEFDPVLVEEKKESLLKTLMQYDIRTVIVNEDLNLNEDNCIRARAYIETLFEDYERWLLVFDNGNKKIYYLKK